MELIEFPDGRVVHKTHLWVTAGADGIVVLLDPPTGPEPSLAVADLKAWCIERPNERQSLLAHGHEVSFDASDVLAGYVDAVLARAGLKGAAAHRISALMPALSRQQNQPEYRDMLVRAVQSACQNAIVNTLTESEMVLEHFHLFRGTLKVKREMTSVFLVVDAGAATTNFTIVLSTKAGRITQAEKGVRPPQLRPVSADARVAGGSLIDNWLLTRAVASDAALRPEARLTALAALERAKIAVSRGQDAAVAHLPGQQTFTVTKALLLDAAKHLWSQLRPTYLDVAARLLAQLTTGVKSTAYKAMIESHDVKRPEDVARLFQAVFIAGGTSLLPGFRDGLLETIGGSPTLSVHPVGGAYPVAAALGAISHLTANDPTHSGVADDGDRPQLRATLPWDIYLDANDNKGGKPSKPNWTKVLDRQDELLREGGERDITLPSSWVIGMHPRARLVPGTSDAFAVNAELRKGIDREPLRVLQPLPEARLVVDPEHETVSLRSHHVNGLDRVTLPLSARADHVQRSRSADGDTFVIDIGMSKTVLARASSARPARDAFDDAYTWVPDVPGFSLPAGSGHTSPAATSPPDGYSPLDILDPVARIQRVVERAAQHHVYADAPLLALAYLGICTRRFVMLAGPPGSGKSTLARLLGDVLGCAAGKTFFDLSVQAHWVNDVPLFGSNGVLVGAFGGSSLTLALFDEINLARPEYYLQRVFGALDHHGQIDDQTTRGLCIVGTLNVDEVSRPPSPKVLDRSMLFYVPPTPPASSLPTSSAWRERAPASTLDGPARRSVSDTSIGPPSPEATQLVERWLQTAHQCAVQHPRVRADVIPSYRARNDLLCFAALHRQHNFTALITEADAMDAAFLGRLVAPLNGPDVEVLPLIEAWLPLARGDGGLYALPRVQRRLERMKQQAEEHAYVSFWQ